MTTTVGAIDTRVNGPSAHGTVAGSIVRVFVAAVLLAAAALKVHQAMTDSLGAGWILSGRTLLVLEIQFEIILGLWLLSGLHRRLSWAAAVMCFGLFACVSFYKGASGASSCGCFGKITVPPWVTLILDVVILFALVSYRPRLKRATTVRFNRLRWAGFVAGAVALGPAAAVAREGRYVDSWPAVDRPTDGRAAAGLGELEARVGQGQDLAEGSVEPVPLRHDLIECAHAYFDFAARGQGSRQTHARGAAPRDRGIRSDGLALHNGLCASGKVPATCVRDPQMDRGPVV